MTDPRLPDPRMIPVRKPSAWFTADQDWPAESESDNAVVPPDTADDSGQSFVRPFVVTEGRTRPLRDDLRIETMVWTIPAALSAPLRFEQRRVVELCQTPRSLAEIAAALRIPLGVARVLAADLSAGNYVELREPTELPVRMIERIRDLVRAL